MEVVIQNCIVTVHVQWNPSSLDPEMGTPKYTGQLFFVPRLSRNTQTSETLQTINELPQEG